VHTKQNTDRTWHHQPAQERIQEATDACERAVSTTPMSPMGDKS